MAKDSVVVQDSISGMKSPMKVEYNRKVAGRFRVLSAWVKIGKITRFSMSQYSVKWGQ